ncbi:hypothetical protein EI546_15545 [Aequorivita sp. H23M31]|uniref:Uncharacterized protein n=1 Tax=Aequorivita ciconiae TaxID=2494375 RepID=A0A410G743_9FLAO|nr:hypothetical protein [Aequorivita sp. H23M31]QAA83041.1 hypothetical protein EI546_15545 [Aequorivita sp. H23M31]
MKKEIKISGFKTPENYFEDFELQLYGRIDEEKLPKSSGFKVSEGYFDTLEEKVIAANATSLKQSKVIPLFQTQSSSYKRYFGYAAAVAAILFIGTIIFNYQGSTKSTLDTIQLGIIDKYIEDGNLNMDLYELSAYFETDEIPLETFGNQYINQTNLEHYLLENTDEELFMMDSSEN